MPLSPRELKRLSDVLTARRNMRPVSVLFTDLQAPASPAQIFEVLKMGSDSDYVLAATADGRGGVPNLNDEFDFVILATAPARGAC